MKPADNQLRAIALQFRPNMPAPMIVAAGSGEFASRIVEVAREAGVSVREDPIVAAALSSSSPGAFIPESSWEVVAALYAFVYAENPGRKDQT